MTIPPQKFYWQAREKDGQILVTLYREVQKSDQRDGPYTTGEKIEEQTFDAAPSVQAEINDWAATTAGIWLNASAAGLMVSALEGKHPVEPAWPRPAGPGAPPRNS